MKYLILCSLFFISTLSICACDCYDYVTFCDVLDNSIIYSSNNKMVCYAEYTGNNVPFQPDRPWHGRYEMKIIDLFYGEIQPGRAGYPNTDSTFWVISGSSSCDDFIFFEEGDHSLMVSSGYPGGDYSFSLCADDLYIYPAALEPEEYTNIVQNIESCWNAHCEEDLVFSNPHWSSYTYQGSTISSTAMVDGRDVIYKAKDRITLQSGFNLNQNNYSFRAEVGAICN